MASAAPASPVLRFGPFELNVVTSELRKGGTTLKLRPQAAKVLVLLATRPGEMVTREQLKEQIWGSGLFVDFEHGLNLCIQQIRAVLNDDANKPRYIETLPRHGYRFIARVEERSDSDTSPQTAAPSSIAVPGLHTTDKDQVRGPQKIARWPRRPWAVDGRGLVALVVAIALFALGGLWERLLRKTQHVRIESLAVLPLENLSRDPDQEYLSDGMTDALTTELAQIGSLRVISRTSAMHFKGTRETLPQIGQELKVDAVVEGSAARAGDRIRITAQLIETQTDRHLWAKSYERSAQDVLALQAEVARDIAEEIRVKLTPEEKIRLTSARPVNLEAHEAYLKGRYFLNKRTEEGFRIAIQYFSEATQKDPNYALGHSGLAESYILMGEYSLLPAKEAFTKAQESAAKALELDDTLAEAHNALAAVKVDYDWDWLGAEREFQRAIVLNPGYATAHQWYAELLSELGRDQEALAEIRQAQQLDPFSLIINTVSADALRSAGQDDLAIEQLRKTLQLDPNFAHAYFHLGMTQLRKGAFAEATAQFQRAATLSPNVIDYKAGLGYAYARLGKRAEARKVLDELKNPLKQRHVSWFYIAAIYAGLDEKHQAFACLEKAYEEREQGLAVMRREPMFDPLRTDPRFQDLMRRMNLPVDSARQ